jgi:hypothetical protein
MCWFIPLIIMAASSIAGAEQQKQAIEMETAANIQAANFNSREAERQAQLHEMQAKDALDRGEIERTRYMRDFQQEQGARAAEMGASGVDVNSGSALDILSDNAAVAALDAKTIRHNAAQEAFGYHEQARTQRVNAMQARNAARYGVVAGEMQKQAALLNTVGSMASMWGNSGMGGGGQKKTPATTTPAATNGIRWER